MEVGKPMSNHFQFNGGQYSYHDAKYNTSRYNERAVEVPIGLDFLTQHSENLLEVGAVLPYYSDTPHTVIDLTDGHEMVTRANVLTYHVETLYSAAISISTLEHVGDGYEDTLRSMQYIQYLLEPNAPYLFTIPHGYNANLDKAIQSGNAPVDNVYHMTKVDAIKHIWKQSDGYEEYKPYNKFSPNANSIYILTGVAKHD
jgi:hypothetical protein